MSEAYHGANKTFETFNEREQKNKTFWKITQVAQFQAGGYLYLHLLFLTFAIFDQ